MARASGLLVVKRVNYFTDPRFSGVPRPSSVGLPDDVVLSTYKGIQGDLWPDVLDVSLVDGVAPLTERQAIDRYFLNVASKDKCDLLYITSFPDRHLPPDDFLLCGFDYGVLESEDNCFSAVYNEVIYGQVPELRRYSESLNQYLLFGSLGAAASFAKARSELASANAPLESFDDDEEIMSIAVFAPRSPS